MTITKVGNEVKIVLDAPWERETVDWLWEQYQEHFLKNLFGRVLYEKHRAKVTIEVRKEVERRLGTHD